MNNNMNIKATMDTLIAMCNQEANYQTCEYLQQSQEVEDSTSMNGPLNETNMLDIDVDCRTKMAAWCYRVVDFCQFDHETVAIAMNILDRFLATPAAASAKADRRVYQLAAMTCLYTAVKIHEPEAMDPALVSKISHGTYTEQEVEAMELTILQAVQWRVNPPTALAFVRECLNLTTGLDKLTTETAYDLAKIQTELAVAEYDFLVIHPSVVAYCSLMNALSSINVDDTTLLNIWTILNQTPILTNLTHLQHSILGEVQACLYDALTQQPAAQTMMQKLACGATPQQTTTNNKSGAASMDVMGHSPSTSPRCISTL